MASYAFRITGIAPTDSAWHTAGESVHRAFWREVVRLVLLQKDAELAAGLDRFGRPMVAIAASTRAKGKWRSYTGLGTPDNPPLDPANELSRMRARCSPAARMPTTPSSSGGSTIEAFTGAGCSGGTAPAPAGSRSAT